jgi:hypothetical protein
VVEQARTLYKKKKEEEEVEEREEEEEEEKKTTTCPITVISCTILTSLLTEKESLIPTVYDRYHKQSDRD